MKLASLWVAALATLPAADWPAFRGINGSGVQSSADLPAEFGPGRNVVWKTDLPYGASSPVVAGDRVWVTASGGEDLITISVDRRSGRELWRTAVPRARREKFHSLNDPAAATPVTDGTNVYVFFPEVGLISFDAKGKERWRHELGPFDNMFGMAASPILAGGSVVLVCDQQRGSFAVAVDAKTGRQVWRAERPDTGIGWALPVLWKSTQVIVAGSRGVTGYSLDGGEMIWRRKLVTDASNGVPLLDGETLYVNAAGYDQPWIPTFEAMSAKVGGDDDPNISRAELAKDETGEFFDYIDTNHDGSINSAEWNEARMAGVGEYGLTALRLGATGEIGDNAVRWRLKKNLPYVPAPVLYLGVLYMVKNGGIVTSVDPKSGEILHQGRAPDAGGEYYASPVAGAGKVFLTSHEGRITVLEAGAKWSVLAVNDMAEQCPATPALDDDSLYVRTRSALYRFRATR